LDKTSPIIITASSGSISFMDRLWPQPAVVAAEQSGLWKPAGPSVAPSIRWGRLRFRVPMISSEDY
jgi:hypothetical protein